MKSYRLECCSPELIGCLASLKCRLLSLTHRNARLQGAYHPVQAIQLAYVSHRVRRVRVNLLLLILRYILLKVVRRSRYAPAAREVTVLLIVLSANLVHILCAWSLYTVFLIFFALLSSAELLRVLVAYTMYTLSPSHIITLAKAAFVSLVRSHHLLNLNALHLQHLLHITLQLRLLVHTLITVKIVYTWHQTARRLLLHLNFDIIEHSVKVYRVQLHRHLDSRILLKVYKWLLYFLVDHSSHALHPPPLILAYLLTVKDYQLHKALYNDDSIVGLASYWILAERKLKQLWKLSQLFNFKKFLDSVA